VNENLKALKGYASRVDGGDSRHRSFCGTAQLVCRSGAIPNVVSPVFGDQVPYVPSASLLDLDTFFADTHRIGVMKLTATDRQMLLEQLAKWLAGRNTHANITALNLSTNSGVQYPNPFVR